MPNQVRTIIHEGLSGIVTTESGNAKQVGSWQINLLQDYSNSKLLNWYLYIDGYGIPVSEAYFINIELKCNDNKTYAGKAVGIGPDFIGDGDLTIN